MKIVKIAILILVLSIFIRPTFAQYNDLSIPTQSITPNPTPEVKVVHYELPYPGILPGNPVYSIKALRDKMVELFTTDPSKRTALYLLQADKRLAASLLLFKSDKPELGETTLSKSQNYLEKSIYEAKKAKEIKENPSDTISKIKASSQKQTSEINEILPKVKGETAEKLKEDLKRAQLLEKSAEALD